MSEPTLAVSRLASILRELLKPPPKKRKETIPTRSSQRKRVEVKKETRYNKEEQTTKNRLLSHKHEQKQKL